MHETRGSAPVVDLPVTEYQLLLIDIAKTIAAAELHGYSTQIPAGDLAKYAVAVARAILADVNEHPTIA